jgi:hypothetical protein
MTPLQLIQYYAGLLILQYLQKPKAFATAQWLASQAILPQTSAQLISFGTTPTSGTFVLNFFPFGVNQTTLQTAAVNWNDTAAQVQTKLQALSGLGSVTVAGSITSTAGLTVTFTGVTPVAALLTITSNSLQASGNTITPTIAETDIVLPLAVANAYNLSTTLGATAVGVCLDTLAKYVGVTRTGSLSTGAITLSDSDFLSLIQFAALKNSAGSDLSSIQSLIHNFFPNQVLVFDYANMQMSYLISSSVGSQNLAKLLVAENVLMRPMGVALGATIYNSVINKFFGFRTYLLVGVNNEPFNNYTSYNQTWPWVSYSMALTTF